MKNIFTFLVIAFFYSTVSAQLKPMLSYGPKAGITFSQTGKDEVNASSYQPKFNGGGVFNIAFNNWFALRTEVYFTGKSKNYTTYNTKSYIEELTKGLSFLGNSIDTSYINTITNVSAQYINDTIYETTRGHVNLNYIELPVLASFTYKGFTFSAGPYFSYLLSAKGSESFKQDVPLLTTIEPALDTLGIFASLFYLPVPAYQKAQIKNYNSTDLFAKFDMGMVLDFTYQANNGFNIGMRYTQGFKNYRITPLNDKDNHQTFMFSVGYNFGQLFGNSKPADKYDLNEKKSE